MGFISSLLAKLHAEFNDLRGTAHPPAVSDKLHELVDELVTRFHALEARIESALHRHEATGAAPNTAVPSPTVVVTDDGTHVFPAPAPAATEEPASLMPATTDAAEAAPSSSDPA